MPRALLAKKKKGKVKVEHCEVTWGSGVVASVIINLGSVWRSVVSYSLQVLYPKEKRTKYVFIWLCRCQSQSEQLGVE